MSTTPCSPDRFLDHVDYLDAAIGQLDARVDVEVTPFRHLITLLITLPGVSHRTAQVIIAETGGDMTVFPPPPTWPPGPASAPD